MNYKMHYDRLIETRLNRAKVSSEYYEKHHIIPRCLGGKDTEDNLVFLTAREHFIAHWLLFKSANNPNEIFKLGKAFRYMSLVDERTQRTIKSHQYEAARKASSEAQKNAIISTETREKISKALKGKKRSPDTIKKMVEARRGKSLTEEHKQKLSVSCKKYTPTKETLEKIAKTKKENGYKHSSETKRKISEATKGRKGRVWTEEQIQKVKESNKGKKRSDETKRRISEANRKRTTSDETKMKLSLASKRAAQRKRDERDFNIGALINASFWLTGPL